MCCCEEGHSSDGEPISALDAKNFDTSFRLIGRGFLSLGTTIITSFFDEFSSHDRCGGFILTEEFAVSGTMD